jgi:malonyl-CoA O-methyltransferase
MKSIENSLIAAPEAYATACILAETTAAEMLTRLEWVTLKPAVILDVGSGSGVASSLLRKLYPDANLLAVDVAYPMLRYAHAQDPSHKYICADAQFLPLADNSVDLIFANLILPWCHDLDKIFCEWRRVLRPDGLLMFSSFGPDTLLEWRSALAEFTLPDLLDMHEIGDALTRTRFASPVMDVENITLSYKSAKKFLQELMNSHMLVAGDYELANSSATVFNAVYEVVYGHAWGPEESVDQVADEFGIVNIPLARLRRQLRS